jgi:DnaJ like chaperone protein
VALEQQTLIDHLCPIFIEVARCDGPVVQSEVRVVREFFHDVLHFDGQAAEAVRSALKAALASPPQDLEALALRARADLKPSLRLDVVRALYDLGLADAELTRREADVLKRVVSQFNLSDEQLQEITQRYFGTGESHYRTLALEPSATDEEIRAAFRRLASENHPDRVASRPPPEAEAASRRFRAVKEAYEELKKLRGL